jgi:hypothetical protein
LIFSWGNLEISTLHFTHFWWFAGSAASLLETVPNQNSFSYDGPAERVTSRATLAGRG